MRGSAANCNCQSASSTLCSCFSMCFATYTTSAPTLRCTDASTVRNGLLGCIAHNKGRHGRLQGNKSQECSSFRSPGAKVSTLFILAHSGAGSSALNLPFPPPKSKRDPHLINFDWIRTAYPRSVCRVIASMRFCLRSCSLLWPAPRDSPATEVTRVCNTHPCRAPDAPAKLD
jgi:hypothetical protein